MEEQTGREIGRVAATAAEPIPAFEGGRVVGDLREAIGRGVEAWLGSQPQVSGILR